MTSATTSLLRRGQAVAAAAAMILMLGAVAQAQDKAQAPARASAADLAPVGTHKAAATEAPNARLAALIRPPGVLIMNKGVQDVSHPQKGVYCILPTTGSGIDPATSLAVVSVEFFYSRFNEIMVQWARSGSPCPKSRFAVYTMSDRNLTARYRFTDDVGFVIYVP
jgi:hypothetical protein